MATINLTHSTFESTLKASDILLVDFWASWCGPCRRFGPIFEKVAQQHPDITFGKIDTEAEGQLAGQFGIRSIPTLAIFREQVLVFMQPGMLPEEALNDLIGKVRALDMKQVRADFARQQKSKPAPSHAHAQAHA